MLDTLKYMLGMDDPEPRPVRRSSRAGGHIELINALTELVAAINQLKAERDALKAENARLWEIVKATGATHD